ncbi:MAG: ribonuclease HIII [Victivallales bacterium]|nr:ribonuclease HIII [Victivallales bacterium]
MANQPHIYVRTLTAEQIVRLRTILEAQGWEMKVPPYTHWQARREKTVVTAYTSGKLTVQGRELENFVLFILEPEILQEAGFGYEDAAPEAGLPAEFTPHGGSDESGKGDYFGPLVIAAVYTDRRAAEQLLELGVRDSKAIKSDPKIRRIATAIPAIVNHRFAVVTIGPEAYNRLYAKIGNVNRMLAWGHARAIENLLQKAPECTAVLADQFGNEALIKNALLQQGRQITLSQRTKAESDIAVAAASIMARNAFVAGLEQLDRLAGSPLPKGAGTKVEQTARELVARHGESILTRVAKTHFRTTAKVLGRETDPNYC